MIGIQTEGIERNERLWAQGLDAYPSTFGEEMGATWGETTVRNPLPSLSRAMERKDYYPSENEFGIEQPPVKESTILDAKRANEEYGIPGELSFGQDVPEPVAEELHRLKRDELQRRDVLNRSTGGIGRTIAGLGVGLAGSILDPINIASAFIPVVGPARYGIWAAKYGPTAARAAKGAAEGLVGAAAVEPLIYGAARSEQADYDSTDSLLNLAFGTVLGGGLHAGLGKIGDLIAQRHAQEPMLRAAVAALAEDRPVDVESGFRAGLLGRAGDDLSATFDALLPPELKVLRQVEQQGPPEAMGPDAVGFALTRQVDNVKAQAETARVEFERLSAERDKAKALADDVTATEVGRLTRVIDEAEAERKQARAARDQALADSREVKAALDRAEGRLSTLEDSGSEGPKVDRARKQAEEARARMERATAAIEDARARLKAAEAAKAERTTQLENYKANRARETVSDIDRRVAEAKARYEGEARNLSAAETALEAHVSGRMAELRQALEDQRLAARDAFMNRAVAVSRGVREVPAEDITARAEIAEVAAKADTTAGTPEQIKQAEADLVDLTARLKTFGSDVDLGDTAKADATAKAYEQAAACDYMRAAAE